MLPNKFILECSEDNVRCMDKYSKSYQSVSLFSRWEILGNGLTFCSNGTKVLYGPYGDWRNYPHITFEQFIMEFVGDIE